MATGGDPSTTLRLMLGHLVYFPGVVILLEKKKSELTKAITRLHVRRPEPR